ncbi:40S ribosomal protein S19, partial [Candidatus Woesearchaeota archaeon]|nr:40S ribosomal protein S19 [Candidatus Woesearchaeota archaeon]
MASIFDVDQTELIEQAAEELKKMPEIKAPEWALFVKTGVSKERPPVRNDWWYVRVASVLRRIYLKGPVGVSK